MERRVLAPNWGKDVPVYLDFLARSVGPAMPTMTAFVHAKGPIQWHVHNSGVFWRHLEGAYLSLLGDIREISLLSTRMVDLNRVPCIVKDVSELKVRRPEWLTNQLPGVSPCVEFPHWQRGNFDCPYDARDWRKLLPHCTGRERSEIMPVERVLREVLDAYKGEIHDDHSVLKFAWERIVEKLRPYVADQDEDFRRGWSFVPCCAQFVLPGTLAGKFPAKMYEELRQVSLDVSLNSYWSSRVFEFLWRRIFGQSFISLLEVEAYHHLAHLDLNDKLI